jgi:cell division protein ZipA
MNELRWILVGFAVVLLAAIYFWGRRGRSADEARRAALSRERSEPGLFSHDPLPETASADAGPDWAVDGDLNAGLATGSHRAERVRPRDALYLEPEPIAEVLPEEPSFEQPPVRRGDGRRTRVEPTLSDTYVDEPVPGATYDEAAYDGPTHGAAGDVPAYDEAEDLDRAEPAVVASAAPSGSAEIVERPAPARVAQPAPTLSSAETPPPKRVERRKILALRLAAAPHRIDGVRLQEVFAAEGLQHGKFDIFHALHDDGAAIFSVASMVEPGTFAPETMAETQYPGVTLFAQLPGPVAGMHALNELVACARRMQSSLGGTLQDDCGVPLTVHRIERMREEVREFERTARL